jgi:acetyl-CoA acyltransferase 2
MSSLLRGVFVVGCKRTAFGSFGGKLKDISSIELAEIASKGALQSANVGSDLIDSVVVGNVIQISSKSGPYISRHVALRLGVPVQVPCLTVNRLCGSGFQAVVNGSQDICLRDSEIVLTIGAENMSQTPFLLRESRFGVKFSQTPQLECGIWTCLTDWHVNLPMGVTAENLANKYNITREEADKLALRSQQRWSEANKKGVFKEEIVSVPVKVKGKVQSFEVDEHPKPDSTLEILSKLPAVFKKDGTVTAGNASGVSDGAAAVVLASEDAVKNRNLKPLARIVGYCSVGVDPSIMGIGPAPAIRKLCERTGIAIKDVDLFDVNEAFAPQYLSVEKELGPRKISVYRFFLTNFNIKNFYL